MDGKELDSAENLLLEALIKRLRGETSEAIEWENQALHAPGFSPLLYGEHLLAAAKRLVVIEGREGEAMPLIKLARRYLPHSPSGQVELHLVNAFVRHTLEKSGVQIGR